MAGASDTIDPIDAARDDIAGSKDLIASAVEDLSQHQLWLENYRVAETKRARRIRRQELMLQAELITKRIIRALRRFALFCALIARAIWRITVTVAVTVARAVAAAWIYVYDVTLSAIAWTAPRVHALALATGQKIAAASAWTLRQSQALALATGRLISAAFAWTLRQGQALALATGRLVSAAFAWTLRQGQALALATGQLISTAFAWTLRQSQALGLATGQLISTAFAWTLRQGQVLAHAMLEGSALAYAWTAPRASAFAVATYRAIAAGLSRLGADAYAFAVASFNAASAGLAWAGVKGRQASMVAGRQGRRGAAAAKRAALAVKKRKFPTLTPENAEAPSEAAASEPIESVPLAVEKAESRTESGSGQSTALVSHRPRRAKPRAIRASRLELRQRPRVAGRSSPAR